MSGQAPESREGPAPANPPAAVQPPLRGTDEGAPHISGDVHTHHPRVEFRFLEQLKHRNVIRIGILYLVVCWLILDPVHVVFHMLEVPPWANRLVVVLMAAPVTARATTTRQGEPTGDLGSNALVRGAGSGLRPMPRHL
jgi:hypothetical protein